MTYDNRNTGISPNTFNSLDELQSRKAEIRRLIKEKNVIIRRHWKELSSPAQTNDKGEIISKIISNGLAIYDGFMLARKLIKAYEDLFRSNKEKS